MKQWALTICVACVLAGGLELFLPQKEYKKSIKSVLALYILVVIVRPIPTVEWGNMGSLLARQEVSAVDYSGYAATLEEDALRASLQQALAEQGVQAAVRSVSPGPPLTVTVATDDPEAARQILQQALGTQQVTINTEDMDDEA